MFNGTACPKGGLAWDSLVGVKAPVVYEDDDLIRSFFEEGRDIVAIEFGMAWVKGSGAVSGDGAIYTQTVASICEDIELRLYCLCVAQVKPKAEECESIGTGLFIIGPHEKWGAGHISRISQCNSPFRKSNLN